MKKVISITAVIALVAVLTLALVACVPADPDKAAANLEEAGYIVSNVKASQGTGVQLGLNAVAKGCVAMVTGTLISTAGTESVAICYFNSAEDAKAYYEKIKAEYDELDDEEKEGYKFGKSGKVIYAGTEAGVKAAG
ncbi:MAG: hypothetical protein J6V83_00970 [Clostridia bacterium]|nr:hypothetical protein [Clostridia bacterium]MBO7155957.1 hypothetical protein [Clostridia bacterium]